jgi:predicted lysophospholipase L1 biosynthesis ABC-type transport system permease subunit
VAVVSYRYWERHLGLDSESVGRVIFANGRPLTIIGILPKAFLGIQPGYVSDLYLPISQVGIVSNKWMNRMDADTGWVQIVGRLRPDASEQGALVALDSVMQRTSGADQRKRETSGVPWRPVLEAGARGIQLLRDEARPTLLILSSVVGVVLLIACANLANLLLARGVARRREIAVRLSIGAGRWRLIRQLLTESLLLAGLGAGIGLSFAPPLTRLILNLAADGRLLRVDAHVDLRTLLFTAAAALVTAHLFGLTPVLRATRVDLTPALKDGSTGRLGQSRGWV